MNGYLPYAAWNEHLADLQRVAAADRRASRRRPWPADRSDRTGLRRLRQALAG